MSLRSPEDGLASQTTRSSGAGVIPVVYLIGSGRSGTTILGSILTGAANAFCVGELHVILYNGCHGDFCGCGQPLFECEHWQRIMRRAGHEWNVTTLNEWLPCAREVIRYGNLPRLLWSCFRKKVRPGAHQRYNDLVYGIYRSIYEETGGKMILELSKHPLIALSMLSDARFNVSLLHLVRDPRAVMYSWSRTKRAVDLPGAPSALMHPVNFGKAIRNWLAENTLTELIEIFVRNYKRVRYEDFASQPHETLAEILQWSGIRGIKPTADGKYVRSGGHLLAGNINRFEKAAIQIRLDDEWQKNLPDRIGLLATIVSAVHLRRYGYKIAYDNGEGTVFGSRVADEFFRWRSLYVGIAVALVVGDYLTGPMYQVPAGFMIPVAFAAASGSLRLAVGLSILQPLVRFIFALHWLPTHSSMSMGSVVFNFLLRVFALLTVTWVVNKLVKFRVAKEHALIVEEFPVAKPA